MKPAVKATALAAFVLLATQYTIVDSEGHVVGSIVTDTPPASLRLIGVTNAPKAPTRPQPAVLDRTFRPDYTRVLTVEQMTRAWQAEVDRLIPQPPTGGG